MQAGTHSRLDFGRRPLHDEAMSRESRALRNDPWPELGPRRRPHRYRHRSPLDNLLGVVFALALTFAAGLAIWWFTADQRDRNELQQRLDTWPVLGSLVHAPNNPIANLPEDGGSGGGGGGGGGGPRSQPAPGSKQLGGGDDGVGYPLK